MKTKGLKVLVMLLLVGLFSLVLGVGCSNNSGSGNGGNTKKYNFEIHWEVNGQDFRVDYLKEGETVTPPDSSLLNSESAAYNYFVDCWLNLPPYESAAHPVDFTNYALTVSDELKKYYNPDENIPITFYALMGSEAKNFDITYELDGGDNAEGNPTSFNAQSNDYDYLKPATKPNYSFVRWTNEDGTVTYEKTEDYKTEYKAIKLYAEFIPAIKLSDDGKSIQEYHDTIELNVPEGVERCDIGYSPTSILKKVTIPSTVNSLYIDCATVEEIVVDEDNPYFCSQDGVVFNKDKTELVCYPAAKGDTEYVVPDTVTRIKGYGFSRTQYTEKVVLPETLNYLAYRAFFCTNILELNIPAALTDIQLDTINIAGSIFIPKTVKHLRQGAVSAFAIFVEASGETNFGDDTEYGNNWNNANEVIYKADPTKRNYGVMTYGDFKFAVSDGNYEYEEFPAKVTILEYVGSDAEVTIPGYFTLQSDGVFYNYKVTRIGNNAFLNNTKTKKIELPNTVEVIGAFAFYGNNNLEEIGVKDANQTLWKIEKYAFNGCYKLKVANLLLKMENGQGYIGDEAFYDCRALEKYVISHAASYVGERAFQFCDNITIYVQHSENNTCMANWSPIWNDKNWDGEKHTPVYDYEELE